MSLETIIPGTSAPDFSCFSTDDSDRYSLALLNKGRDKSSYFLLDGLTDFDRIENVDSAISISRYKSELVVCQYFDVSITKEITSEGTVYTLNHKDFLNGFKEEIIPFRFKETPQVELIDNSLLSSIEDYCDAQERYLFDIFQRCGEEGVYKTFFNEFRGKTTSKKKYALRSSELVDKLDGFFHEELSPSSVIPYTKRGPFLDRYNYHDFASSFRAKAFMYLGMPNILYFAPDAIKDDLFDELKSQHDKRFENSDDESENMIRALSSHMLSNPHLFSGLSNIFKEGAKLGSVSVASIETSAALLGSSVSLWLGAPLTLYASLSNVVRLKNLVASRGSNARGLLSSKINSVAKEK